MERVDGIVVGLVIRWIRWCAVAVVQVPVRLRQNEIELLDVFQDLHVRGSGVLEMKQPFCRGEIVESLHVREEAKPAVTVAPLELVGRIVCASNLEELVQMMRRCR